MRVRILFRGDYIKYRGLQMVGYNTIHRRTLMIKKNDTETAKRFRDFYLDLCRYEQLKWQMEKMEITTSGLLFLERDHRNLTNPHRRMYPIYS